jgi:small-conductance mechanosensitive channel
LVNYGTAHRKAQIRGLPWVLLVAAVLLAAGPAPAQRLPPAPAPTTAPSAEPTAEPSVAVPVTAEPPAVVPTAVATAAPLPAPSASSSASPRAPAAPASSVAPAAHAAAAGSATPVEGTTASGLVRIHDRRVFEVLVPRGNRTPEQRAAEVTKRLEGLLDEQKEADITVEGSVVYGGATQLIELDAADAEAAGDASAHAAAVVVADKVRAALKAERQRSAIATTVFAFSLLVFSGLIAFLLVRKVGELLEKLRGWVDNNPTKLPTLRVRGIEVLQPTAVRGGIDVSLSGAILVARVGIFYTWVLIALSLFDATHDYSERLTGFVLTPVSALVGRVALALPLLVIALVTVFAVAISLRFVRLFFGSMARGETTVGWMPKDLAEPTSILVRSGIVLITVVIAAPLITGTDDGTLSRAGVVALVAIGLAATPLLACAAAGIAVVFGRRLRVGDRAGVGGREGRVRALTMLEVLLEDDDGCAVHVPHLLGLWHPTRVVSPTALVVVELSIDSATDLARVVDLTRKTAGTLGGRPKVDVLALDADGAHLRVAVAPRGGADKNALFCALSAALRAEGVALGRVRAGRPT